MARRQELKYVLSSCHVGIAYITMHTSQMTRNEVEGDFIDLGVLTQTWGVLTNSSLFPLHTEIFIASSIIANVVLNICLLLIKKKSVK